MKTRLPVEKYEEESGAWQQRVKISITVATRGKSPRVQSSTNEIENLSKVCQTPGGGGVHDLRMDGGLPHGFLKATLF